MLKFVWAAVLALGFMTVGVSAAEEASFCSEWNYQGDWLIATVRGGSVEDGKTKAYEKLKDKVAGFKSGCASRGGEAQSCKFKYRTVGGRAAYGTVSATVRVQCN